MTDPADGGQVGITRGGIGPWGCRAAPLVLALAACAGTPPSAVTPAAAPPETVVLLHGLGRTPGSMRPLEAALEARGYRVVNLGYPSRREPIDALVDSLSSALESCCGGQPVHFVTHSLGGILVRVYAERHGHDGIGRVVMLSPPNAGSELVDRLAGVWPVSWLLGPAFLELGTDTADGPARLPPPKFEAGVITGDATLSPLFSWWLPGEDDGKVSVTSARLEGAEDFLVVPHTHTFIMRKEDVITQVVAFLGTGRFLRDDPPGDDPPDDGTPPLAAAGSDTATSSHGR